jgi:predicted TIM-barrel fold metal-dependent hydrolase
MDHGALAAPQLPVLIHVDGEVAPLTFPSLTQSFFKHTERLMSAARRIDVHQHVIPRFWADKLPSNGGDHSGTVIPRWSPQNAVDLMNSQQIATGILSLTAPSVAARKPAERRTMARSVNGYTADLVVKRPARFGHFATLPLPDVDDALHEIEYALDELRAEAVVLLSNYEGKYLADPTFEPLWAGLGRHSAVVFVHPGLPQIRGLDAVAAPIVDYPFDTARAAVQLVQNGVIDRSPHVRIILAHADGFLPYASHRFAQLTRVFRPDANSPADILAKFSGFYSTPGCRRVQSRYRRARPSPERSGFSSAAISPMSQQIPPALSLNTWTPTMVSLSPSANRLTTATPGHYFHASRLKTTRLLELSRAA